MSEIMRSLIDWLVLLSLIVVTMALAWVATEPQQPVLVERSRISMMARIIEVGVGEDGKCSCSIHDDTPSAPGAADAVRLDWK